MLLKKGQLLFQYPAMDTQVIIEKGGELELGGDIPPFPLYDTL